MAARSFPAVALAGMASPPRPMAAPLDNATSGSSGFRAPAEPSGPGGVLDFDEAQAVLVNWIRAINVGDAHESKRVIEAVVETAKSLAGEASFRRTFGRPSGAPVPAGRTMLHLCWVSPTP